MQNIDATALDSLSIAELAKLPPTLLADLCQETDAAIALWRKRRALLDFALDQRYGKQAQEARQKDGKDSGVIRLTDGECQIITDAKKSVYWDQTGLAALAERIRAEGDDPGVYIVAKTELTVRETAYKDWPENVRAAFEPHRTVKPGRASYRIERPAADREAA